MDRRAVTLKVQKLPADDTWKDIIRIKNKYRTDIRGDHIKRGTMCCITVGERSRWVVVHGREVADKVIQMDLNVRLALGLDPDTEYQFELEKLSFLERLWFPWKASDPIYRIPAQLGLISFLLGTVLGLIGIALGNVALKH
jgi:hypothetical protein